MSTKKKSVCLGTIVSWVVDGKAVIGKVRKEEETTYEVNALIDGLFAIMKVSKEDPTLRTANASQLFKWYKKVNRSLEEDVIRCNDLLGAAEKTASAYKRKYNECYEQLQDALRTIANLQYTARIEFYSHKPFIKFVF